MAYASNDTAESLDDNEGDTASDQIQTDGDPEVSLLVLLALFPGPLVVGRGFLLHAAVIRVVARRLILSRAGRSVDFGSRDLFRLHTTPLNSGSWIQV